jgi:hypothetical protein
MVDSPNDANLRYSVLLVLDLFLTVSIQMIGFAPRQLLDAAAQSVSSDGASLALVEAHNPSQNKRTCEAEEIASTGPASMRLFMRSAHRRAPSVVGPLERMTPDEGRAGSVRGRNPHPQVGELRPHRFVVAVAVGAKNVGVGAVGSTKGRPTFSDTRRRSEVGWNRPGNEHSPTRPRREDPSRTHMDRGFPASAWGEGKATRTERRHAQTATAGGRISSDGGRYPEGLSGRGGSSLFAAGRKAVGSSAVSPIEGGATGRIESPPVCCSHS